MKTRRLSEKLPARRSRWPKRIALFGLAAGIAATLAFVLAPKRSHIDWSVAHMPSQSGRIFLVTGGNSGIGYECARALAAAGADVVIASRNAERSEEAIAQIRKETPGAEIRFEPLDLGDLASVRALGKRLAETLPRLDGLINNAALMTPPERGTTKDGFEIQFGVNYLGHFALTAELLPLLRKAESPRVVTMSSVAASRGAIHYDDLQFEKSYEPWAAYGQSKLACLLFARELQRRSEAGGWGIRSMAAHPGLSRTNLQANQGALRRCLRVLFQSAEKGAVPALYAATAPDARGGDYYGPVGFMQARGPLGLASVPAPATDAAAAARLWTASEQLTGARFR